MMIQIPASQLDDLIASKSVNDLWPNPKPTLPTHLFQPHTSPSGWDKRLCSYHGCGASPETAVHLA